MKNETIEEIKCEMNQNEKIDWARFGSQKYLKIPTGESKVLKLTNWRQVNKFDKDMLEFDVVSEDNEPVEKIYSLSAIKAIFQMKPIIDNAEKSNRKIITVKIVKVGDGVNTVYNIKEV